MGGIPRTKAPPLEYQTVYSLTSVLSAYVRPAQIVVDGQDTSVDSLSGVEQLEFPPPLGTLEAFYTDGLGSLRLTKKGRVRRLLAEKTIRYCGHAARKIADGTIQETGVRFPEQLFVGALGDELLRALDTRGMSISHSETSPASSR